MEKQILKNTLKILKEQRGFDFSGYRQTMLFRRIQKRIYATKCRDLNEYYNYLENNTDEFDNLIDVLTINVSSFFRDSLPFEFISRIIIPELLSQIAAGNDNNLRVWSAGCSFGEEVYSIAILINEFLNKEDIKIKPNIFATDIDKKALIRAKDGVYNANSIEHVKYRILSKYFEKEKEQFKLSSEIKKMVHFSFYDLLDKNNSVPPDSIYGNFDIVLCRNVLIYFEFEYQKIIFDKLYRSLKPNGYLILGEAETPIEEFKHKFKRENNFSKIYKKIG
ncbi:MAG: protein-glutamate O-methyltransferase CheR [Saprospiraceae bacterium]|nr:protein-glutamate O-methyltransferase CheR [Saprospiraceae bacterium]